MNKKARILNTLYFLLKIAVLAMIAYWLYKNIF